MKWIKEMSFPVSLNITIFNTGPIKGIVKLLLHFKRQSYKMVKHIQKIRRQQ